MRFRRAVAEERVLLDEMTLAGIRHWGHHEKHPEAYRGLADAIARDSGPEDHLVFVLEDGDELIGFYELRDRGDHVELLRMFLDTVHIGRGLGRLLWDHAIERARDVHDRLLINSDPGAAGFYRAMGAEPIGEVKPAPGFVITTFQLDLTP